MNKKGSKQNNKRPALILSVLCIVTILLSAIGFLPISGLRQASDFIFVPMQKGVAKVGRILGGGSAVLRSSESLTEENKQLKQQIAALEERTTVSAADQSELERLRKLYEFDSGYTQYDKVAAKVVAKEPGSWYTSFTINRGTNSGIQKDMNVVTGGGLVGIVTETGPTWSRVRSIAAENSSVSAMTMSSLDTCVVSGSEAMLEEGKLAFSQMHTSNNVIQGEKLVTSNISDKYLEGILVGYIDTIQDDSNHLTKKGNLIPAVDFAHLHEVLVIKHLKQSGEN